MCISTGGCTEKLPLEPDVVHAAVGKSSQISLLRNRQSLHAHSTSFADERMEESIIYINDERHAVKSGQSIEDILFSLYPDPEGVALAINGKVVPRRDWTRTIPESQSKLIVITPAQGG